MCIHSAIPVVKTGVSLRVSGQKELHSETLFQKQTNKQTTKKKHVVRMSMIQLVFTLSNHSYSFSVSNSFLVMPYFHVITFKFFTTYLLIFSVLLTWFLHIHSSYLFILVLITCTIGTSFVIFQFSLGIFALSSLHQLVTHIIIPPKKVLERSS